MQQKPSLSQIEILIRPELFDHLIYPIGTKLDDNNIILLFRKLHVLSEIDFKISLQEWKLRAVEFGLTETEANVLFQTYKVFDSDINNEFTSNSANSRYEGNNSKNSVDVRFFGLFFALQAFSQRTKISLNIDRGDKSPFNYHLSNPLSSPRGKTSNSSRGQTPGLEHQFIVNFVKSNLKLFLRIIASDIHNTETSLNASEFNTLKFLFKIYDPNNTTNQSIQSYSSNKKNPNQLCNYADFFENVSPVSKVNMNIANEWLLSVISNDPPSDYFKIKNLSKSVSTTSECTNESILITQCDDSHFFINTNVANCKISHCTNCTIVIAAVNKIISIDKCVKCKICVVTNFIRISNTIDSNIYFYSVNEPILFGDNRGICLGPHNVTYSELYTHIKNSKLMLLKQGLNNFANPIVLNSKNNEQTSIIQPINFTTITVPFEAKDPLYFKLTPKPYIEVIEKKLNNYLSIKSMIKDIGLTEDQEKNLHICLQGYFREWLANTGTYKEMDDIVKMIDNNLPKINEDHTKEESD